MRHCKTTTARRGARTGTLEVRTRTKGARTSTLGARTRVRLIAEATSSSPGCPPFPILGMMPATRTPAISSDSLPISRTGWPAAIPIAIATTTMFPAVATAETATVPTTTITTTATTQQLPCPGQRDGQQQSGKRLLQQQHFYDNKNFKTATFAIFLISLWIRKTFLSIMLFGNIIYYLRLSAMSSFVCL